MSESTQVNMCSKHSCSHNAFLPSSVSASLTVSLSCAHSVTQHLILSSLLWLHKPFFRRTWHHSASRATVSEIRKLAWGSNHLFAIKWTQPSPSLLSCFFLRLSCPPLPTDLLLTGTLPIYLPLSLFFPPLLRCLIFLCDYTLTSRWTEMTALAWSPDIPQLLKAQS